MLPLLLVVQLQTTASHSLHLTPATRDAGRDTRAAQEQRMRMIEEVLRQVNQRQQESEAGQQTLHDRSSPSRVDCYPLFPPVSGYPPGLNRLACD